MSHFHSVLPNSNPPFRPTLTLLSLARSSLCLVLLSHSLAHFTLYLVPLLLSSPTLSFYLSPHSHFSFPNPTLFAVLLALLSVSHSTLLSLFHSIFFYRSTLSPVSLFIFISPTLPSHSTRTVGLLKIGKKFKRWRDWDKRKSALLIQLLTDLPLTHFLFQRKKTTHQRILLIKPQISKFMHVNLKKTSII